MGESPLGWKPGIQGPAQQAPPTWFTSPFQALAGAVSLPRRQVFPFCPVESSFET